MTGFANMIRRNSRDYAVYWGNPQDDGYGGRTFNAPVEIRVRWDDREQLLTVDEGEKIISRAIVWINQDLDVNGAMWKGRLTSLTAGQKSNPRGIEDICLVKRMERYPSLLSSLDIVWKAFLTPWLT